MKTTSDRSTSATWMAIGSLVFLLAACGGGGEPSTADVAQGRQHYQSTCALCHGAEGEGKARLGRALQDNSFVDSLDDEALVEFLRVGRPAWDPANEQGVDMPPKGGNPALTDDNLMQIVAYLRTL